VGRKSPNPWGLYDIYGNVSEWCLDWYDPNFYSSTPKIDPRNNDPRESDSRLQKKVQILAYKRKFIAVVAGSIPTNIVDQLVAVTTS